MPDRIPAVTGEIYHVYNRGVDKRTIFQDGYDLQHFLLGLTLFNNTRRIYSIRNELNNIDYSSPTAVILRRMKREQSEDEKIVNIIAYHLLGNHFHILLQPTVDGGLGKFMQRLSGGYTGFFNRKYERSGVLLQGKYKYAHIQTDEYLNYLFAYINFNHIVHDFDFSFSIPPSLKKITSSLDQYHSLKEDFLVCDVEKAHSLIDVPTILHSGEKLTREIKHNRDLQKLALE